MKQFAVCKADYHINDQAAEFLKLRGVYNDTDVQQYKKEAKKEEQQSYKAEDKIHKEDTHQLVRRSMKGGRNGEANGPGTADAPCCCQPIDVRMEAFINQKKFENEMERIKKQGTAKSQINHGQT